MSPRSTSSTRLVPATSSHFEWLSTRDESTRSGDGLSLPPGGVESPEVLSWIARSARAVEAATGAPAAWLVVERNEVVGMVSLKGPPREGAVEIGYGIAESRRARGHATRAVALVIAELGRRGLQAFAETTSDNRASQLVLERNGFVRCGERVDPDEGVLVTWRRRRPA